MKYTSVNSSAIARIGYDAASGNMLIEFPNGSTQQHAGVTKEQYEAFLKSDSKGKYYSTHFRIGSPKPPVKRKTSFR